MASRLHEGLGDVEVPVAVLGRVVHALARGVCFQVDLRFLDGLAESESIPLREAQDIHVLELQVLDELVLDGRGKVHAAKLGKTVGVHHVEPALVRVDDREVNRASSAVDDKSIAGGHQRGNAAEETSGRRFRNHVNMFHTSPRCSRADLSDLRLLEGGRVSDHNAVDFKTALLHDLQNMLQDHRDKVRGRLFNPPRALFHQQYTPTITAATDVVLDPLLQGIELGLREGPSNDALQTDIEILWIALAFYHSGMAVPNGIAIDVDCCRHFVPIIQFNHISSAVVNECCRDLSRTEIYSKKVYHRY